MDKLNTLISDLLGENRQYRSIGIPAGESERFQLFRSLVNVRAPAPIPEKFLKIQDEFLREKTTEKGITDIDGLTPIRGELYLWRGDITTLKCGAIVNAANSRMLGCFCPCHGCIDNAIHTFAGVQLRAACAELMKKQGGEEPAGRAKITPAYNLPCEYVLHTVGPIVAGKPTREDEALLASCYRSCLELAEENGIESVAFCCISTGEFHFPNERAAQIAVETVTEFKKERQSKTRVIFNVFKELDLRIYRELLGSDRAAEKRA